MISAANVLPRKPMVSSRTQKYALSPVPPKQTNPVVGREVRYLRVNGHHVSGADFRS